MKTQHANLTLGGCRFPTTFQQLSQCTSFPSTLWRSPLFNLVLQTSKLSATGNWRVKVHLWMRLPKKQTFSASFLIPIGKIRAVKHSIFVAHTELRQAAHSHPLHRLLVVKVCSTNHLLILMICLPSTPRPPSSKLYYIKETGNHVAHCGWEGNLFRPASEGRRFNNGYV